MKYFAVISRHELEALNRAFEREEPKGSDTLILRGTLTEGSDNETVQVPLYAATVQDAKSLRTVELHTLA
jgi:hypothetical protein